MLQEAPGDLPMTVADMVLLGRAPHQATFSRASADDHRIAAAALRRVGARHLADRVFVRLSGGEKQRVMIAGRWRSGLRTWCSTSRPTTSTSGSSTSCSA